MARKETKSSGVLHLKWEPAFALRATAGRCMIVYAPWHGCLLPLRTFPGYNVETMYLLAIETSSARGGLALVDSDRGLVEEVVFPEGLVHGREITARLEGLMDRHGLRPADLGAVAVSRGPGSYTGIRVGVTAAKTLAFALGISVVPVSSLEVIAWNVVRDPLSVPADKGSSHVLVLLDGKQGQLYRALYRLDGAQLERVTEEKIVDRRSTAPPGGVQLLQDLPQEATLLGDGAEIFLDGIPEVRAVGFFRGPREWDWPRASVLGALAVASWRKGGAISDRSAIHRLVPVYLRPSEAERKFQGLKET